MHGWSVDALAGLGMEQVNCALGMAAQACRVGQLGRGARVAAGHQFDIACVRVHVRLAAEILNQVDDDLDPTGIGEFELFGPDAEGDL